MKEYVREAFDPANSVPGWTRAAIQEELETMIYMNRGQDSSNRIRWRTMELPQHIDPQYLPYERAPGDRNKDIPLRSPAPPSKMYPGEFCAPFSNPKILFRHNDGNLFVSHQDYWELLAYTDGACINNGQANSRAGCAFVTHCSDGIPRPWNPPVRTVCMAQSSFAWKMPVPPAFVRGRAATGQNFAPF